MAAQSGDPAGEPSRPATLAEVVAAVQSRVSAAEWARVTMAIPAGVRVVWPTGVVARALANLIQNAAQAAPDGAVTLEGHLHGAGRVTMTVADRGPGMTTADLARAGEPFFTTKPPAPAPASDCSWRAPRWNSSAAR